MNTAVGNAENVELHLDIGPILGYREEGLAIFKGIPYAQPPVGNLRWKPPQKLTPWKEIKTCLDFGPVCPQAEYPRTSIYRISPRPQSEDCLYLNVWTPSLDVSAKLPVMVWIHGGNLERGSSCLPFYNGSNLAKEGVVMLSINYRVGVLGFLAHPELSAESERGISGNYALLDQIAALKWVQENIHHFGGDKDQVCIFGQSAGSWSVNTLMASPLAKRLFHRVIGQSGASFYGERHLKENRANKASAESLGEKFMQKMGVKNLADLREASAENLVKAAFSEDIQFKSEFVVDGYALPSSVQEIFGQSRQNQVPLMLGLTAREWSGFVNLKALPRDLHSYKEMLEKRYPGKWELFSTAYPVKSKEDILPSHLDHWGDLVFGVQIRRWARAAAKTHQPVYLYFFSREPRSRQREFLGAFHAAEIPYAFGILDKVPNAGMYEDWDFELSEKMFRYWLDFAKGDFDKYQRDWPAFKNGEEVYLEFGDKVSLGENLLEKRWDVLEELLTP